MLSVNRASLSESLWAPSKKQRSDFMLGIVKEIKGLSGSIADVLSVIMMGARGPVQREKYSSVTIMHRVCGFAL